MKTIFRDGYEINIIHQEPDRNTIKPGSVSINSTLKANFFFEFSKENVAPKMTDKEWEEHLIKEAIYGMDKITNDLISSNHKIFTKLPMESDL